MRPTNLTAIDVFVIFKKYYDNKDKFIKTVLDNHISLTAYTAEVMFYTLKEALHEFSEG